jgi:hypothetical protein
MATTTSPIPTPEQTQPINHFGRMTGVLFSPKQTFSEIANRPSWLLPVVLLVVLSSIAGVLVTQKTDWRSFFERQMSQNSRFDQMSQDQKDRILEQQMTWAPKIGIVIAPVATVVLILVLTLVYWGAFNLFSGAGLDFGTSIGISSHALIPVALSNILAIVTLVLKAKGDVDPEHILASSLGAFLPDNSAHWLNVLGQSVELFWIWSLALVAIGFVAARPKKINTGSAFGIVFGLWLLYVVCRVGVAAI